jgi:replication factor C subunit 3/5
MQEGLNKVLKERSTQAHFVFTTNHLDRLIPSLKSRCRRVPFGPANPDGWLLRLKMIYRNEGVPVPADNEIKRTIELAMGDCRDILEQAEDYVCDIREPDMSVCEEPSI